MACEDQEKDMLSPEQLEAIDLGYECKHCSQHYHISTFRIATYFYGMFILTGEKRRYVGSTCPRCLNTILISCDEALFTRIMESLRGTIYLYSPPAHPDKPRIPNLGIFDLQYRSTFNYFTKSANVLNKHNIVLWEGDDAYIPSDPKLSDENARLSIQYDAELSNIKNHLRSYDFNWQPPSGTLFLIMWFKEDEIDNLVDIENDPKKLRVFPRYSIFDSTIERIDRLCWYLYLNETQDQNELIGTYAGWSSPLSLITDFLNILVGTTIGIPERQSHYLFDREIPMSLVDIDPFESIYIEEMKRVHFEMVGAVKSSCHLESFQSFLAETALNFFKDYLQLAKKSDFYYDAVWDLKEKYLSRAYRAAVNRTPYQARHQPFDDFSDKPKASDRPSTITKRQCREKAKELWDDAIKNGNEILRTGAMALHPEIKKLSGVYTKDRVQRWLSKIAPKEAKRPGAYPRKKQ